MDPCNRNHRIPADFIRQQPEYKAIVSKKYRKFKDCTSTSNGNAIFSPTTSGEGQDQNNYQEAFSLRRKSLVLKPKCRPYSSFPKGRIGTSSSLDQPQNAFRTFSSIDQSQKAFGTPSCTNQSQNTKVILKLDEDMGLKKSKRSQSGFSWHTISSSSPSKSSSPATSSPSQEHSANSKRYNQPGSQTVLVCHKVASKARKPQIPHMSVAVCQRGRLKVEKETLNFSNQVAKTDYNILVGKSEKQRPGNMKLWSQSGDIYYSTGGGHVDEIGEETGYYHSSNKTILNARDNIPTWVEDQIEIDDRTEVETPVSNDSPQNMKPLLQTFHEQSEEIPVDRFDESCNETPKNENFSKDDNQLLALPSSAYDCESFSKESNPELKISKFNFADASDTHNRRSHLKRVQSAGSSKIPRPPNFQGDGTSFGYDARLEKSAVYLRSQNKTFTRASQYVETNRRGLSLINVHYSKTNTGFNDRIIFADLLKSAHTTNAVIGDNVYTMERRLYNRRKDPTRCTTFYDRFQNTAKNPSLRRVKSAPAAASRRRLTKTADKPSSTRTVAGKLNARKERIQKKKKQMEMGYVPRMNSLNIPNSSDMDNLLASCRYLRIQPYKQPWLYQADDQGDIPDETKRGIQSVSFDIG